MLCHHHSNRSLNQEKMHQLSGCNTEPRSMDYRDGHLWLSISPINSAPRRHMEKLLRGDDLDSTSSTLASLTDDGRLEPSSVIIHLPLHHPNIVPYSNPAGSMPRPPASYRDSMPDRPMPRRSAMPRSSSPQATSPHPATIR